MQKTWYSLYDFSFDYKGSEPPYADPSAFDWAKDMQQHADVLREELHAYLRKKKLDSYFNSSMVSKKNSWKTIALKTWSVELYRNQEEFPRTAALIRKYPQIVSASFNLLEPKSRIMPHCGDTNAIYRCHLGLEIPAGLPACGLRVKGEDRPWKNNEWLVFMDAYVHEAWNDTDQERYIFLVDVMREGFGRQRNKVCSTVLTSLFLQKRAEKYKILLRARPFFVKSAGKALRPFAQLAVLAANRFRVY